MMAVRSPLSRAPKLRNDPAAIGHFMVTEVGKTPRDETLPKPKELSRSRFHSESETPQLPAAPVRPTQSGKEPTAAAATEHPSIIQSTPQPSLVMPSHEQSRGTADATDQGPINDGAPRREKDAMLRATRTEPKPSRGASSQKGVAQLAQEGIAYVLRKSRNPSARNPAVNLRIHDAVKTHHTAPPKLVYDDASYSEERGPITDGAAPTFKAAIHDGLPTDHHHWIAIHDGEAEDPPEDPSSTQQTPPKPEATEARGNPQTSTTCYTPITSTGEYSTPPPDRPCRAPHDRAAIRSRWPALMQGGPARPWL